MNPHIVWEVDINRHAGAIDDLSGLIDAFERTATDPGAWIEACTRATAFVGGVGATIVPANLDLRRMAIPHTAAHAGPLEKLAMGEWATRDPRARAWGKAVNVGYASDDDVLTHDEIETDPYYNELAKFGLRWFCSTGILVNNEAWALAISRRVGDEPFGNRERERMLALRPHLERAARRTAVLGERRKRTLEDALIHSGRAVFVLDWSARVIGMNQNAEDLARRFGMLRNNRFHSRHAPNGTKISEFALRAVRFCPRRDSACAPMQITDPTSGQVLMFDAIPLPRDYQSLAGNVCAIITINVVGGEAISESSFSERFNLTRREAQLAMHLASGLRLDQFAERHGLSIGTARQHLKSVFAKTQTNRQAQLVAMIGRSSD